MRWTIVRCVEWNLNRDAARGAEKFHALVIISLRAAAKDRLPGGKFQQTGSQTIGAEIGIEFQQSGYALRFFAKKPARKSDRVAADIQQTTAAPFGLVTHVLRIAIEIVEHRDDRFERAGLSVANKLAHSQPLRMRFDHERFADFYSGAIARPDQFDGLRRVAADRLFA